MPDYRLMTMSDWFEKDLQYIWHPYTQMKDIATNELPLLCITAAKGSQLYASDGRHYYDTISSWWCNVHGHNHPTIQSAIQNQVMALDHVLLAGFTHPSAIALAEQLIGITPSHLTKVFYSDNGSTSIEVALKMSYQYWQHIGRPQKQKFLALDHGYHGDTIGTMSVSGESVFTRPFAPLLFDSLTVPSPYCYRCPFAKTQATCQLECADALAACVQKNQAELAAIIMEPMLLGAGGMIVYPKEYLERAGQIAQKYGVHLILDEVATGFGRTGKMFASEYAPTVLADFLCLSKGLTSGTLPLAATLTTEAVYHAFYDDYATRKTFYHGHTFTANPIACSAALGSLSIFESEKTLARIQPVIAIFQQQLATLHDIPIVGDVRTIGLIAAVELVKDKLLKTSFAFEERIGLSIYKEGLKRGLILRPMGNVIYLFLPLCITQAEILEIMASLRDILGILSNKMSTQGLV